jgi:CxxC motif-containing protein (DUF1111 family)
MKSNIKKLSQGKKLILRTAIVASILAGATAVAQFTQPPSPPRQPPAPAQPPPIPVALQGFGQALSGLSVKLMAAFEEGRQEFVNIETPEGGLGPIFNGKSCAECHTSPVVGGGSNTKVTRFGRVVNDKFDPLDLLGGSLLQRFAIDPAVRETIPREANVIAQRMSTPLFGLGLIEAIPDSTLIQNARIAKPDGVRGRAAEVTDITTGENRIGRFGWKAQLASILAFSADAYSNEMGITNRFFPVENAPNGNQALLAKFKRTADPEDVLDTDGRGDIDLVADYMRLLAPPPRLPMNAQALAGEVSFTQLGCASCHTATLHTGLNAIPALDRKPVNLYSDLLLHDMGRLNDGIAQSNATMHEMRTAPLWGLRARDQYLHDGRANTVDAAIRAHDGEGTVSRDRYNRLNQQQRQQLLDFLATL